MESFVERYNDWLDDLLNDPGDRRRNPVAKRLRDLDAHQKSVYERILKTSQARAQIAYCEASITLRDGVTFYQWPGNFRRFLGFERRIDGNANNIGDRMRTIAPWELTRGIVLMTPERGFRVAPAPVLTADESWTLMYQKGPIHPHWGTVAAAADTVGSNFIKIPTSIPPEQGRLVPWSQYYVGETIRILEANSGAGQAIQVDSYNPADGRCTLKHNFAPVPTGTIKYEFGSFLPEGYDKLVALSVALAYTPMRDRGEQRALLTKEWKEMYAACSHYFNNQTADRPHQANPNWSESTVDPMAQ